MARRCLNLAGRDAIGTEISRRLKWGARAGYAARGMVYLLVGGLAFLAAIGAGSTEGTHGALRTLLGQPFGSLLVSLLGLGLVAFALWRFAQSLADLDRHGTDPRALVIRLALFFSGVIHLALAVFVVSLIVAIGGSGGSGGSGGGSGDPTSGWLQWLFGHKGGRWAALALSLVPIGVGLAHIAKGWRAGYEKYIVFEPGSAPFLKPVCSFGLIARGLIFVVIGVLAFYAGGIYDATSAPGLEDALVAIQNLPFGGILFVLTALGLLAFSGYCFVEAGYRQIATGRLVAEMLDLA
ncbi:DUF1206 domain-containing protein [Afifella pfennigii]|uniref:DUF1206 domain-containing protein n=1 Tax=Afifella pfennigii TaxID=209897 RepID=UPI00068F18D4|nr:DUF1206 domain-containing protein [Afifella pfennigii]